MRFPLPTAALLCGLLLCEAAHAEQTACQRFEQQYAEQYTVIRCVDKDTAVVTNQQDEWALADSQNRLLVPFGTYADIFLFDIFIQDGRLLLSIRTKDNKQGVIDGKGKIVVPPQYDNIQMPRKADEPIVIIKNGEDGRRYGLAGQAGKILLEPHYYWIGDFSEGLAAYTANPVSKYGEDNPHIRVGYLDTQGKTVITPQFAQAARFSTGVAWVKQPDSGDWLLIDRTGKTLMRAPYVYQEIEDFDENGLAKIKKNNLYGLINKRGDSVLAAEYNRLYWKDTEQFYLLQKDGKFGAANAQGKVVIAPEFDAATYWDRDKEETPQGQAALIRGTTVYLFDQNGQQIDQRPARYAQQCAHVAVGLPHKTQAGYRVSEFYTDYTDSNIIVFTNANGDIATDTCSDVAAPHKKGKTSKKRRS